MSSKGSTSAVEKDDTVVRVTQFVSAGSFDLDCSAMRSYVQRMGTDHWEKVIVMAAVGKSVDHIELVGTYFSDRRMIASTGNAEGTAESGRKTASKGFEYAEHYE